LFPALIRRRNWTWGAFVTCSRRPTPARWCNIHSCSAAACHLIYAAARVSECVSVCVCVPRGSAPNLGPYISHSLGCLLLCPRERERRAIYGPHPRDNRPNFTSSPIECQTNELFVVRIRFQLRASHLVNNLTNSSWSRPKF
jgi:hypothetical protein